MTTPIESAADALLENWHTDDAREHARAVLASLAKHRDDIARALCYRALGGNPGGTVPSDASICEPHRRDADAVLAYLVGETS